MGSSGSRYLGRVQFTWWPELTVSEDLIRAGAAASELLTKSICFSPHRPPHRAAYDKISRASDPRECKKVKAQIDAAVSFIT